MRDEEMISHICKLIGKEVVELAIGYQLGSEGLGFYVLIANTNNRPISPMRFTINGKTFIRTSVSKKLEEEPIISWLINAAVDDPKFPNKVWEDVDWAILKLDNKNKKVTLELVIEYEEDI